MRGVADENLPGLPVASTVDDERDPARSRGQEDQMGYRETREVARIRAELRDRLMSDRFEGAGDVFEPIKRNSGGGRRGRLIDMPASRIRRGCRATAARSHARWLARLP